VNLFWAIDRMKRLFAGLMAEGASLDQIKAILLAEAHAMYEEDIAACKAMGAYGGVLLPDEGGVLTHCNAGRTGHVRLWDGSGSDSLSGRAGQADSCLSPTKRGRFCKARGSRPGN
jgi:hypothetical protein